MAGPSDIYTMTPGSAVADQLQDILARKRAEARQNLLDSITAVNTQSDINYKQQIAASLDEQRKAHAQDYQSMIDERNAKAQKDKDFLTQMGNWTSTPEYTSLDPSVKTQIQLAKIAGPDALRNVISNLRPPTKAEGGDIFVTGRDGNPYDSGVWAPAGSHFVTQPAPEKDPASLSVPQLYQIPDPQNPGQYISYWLKPGEQPNEKNRIQGGTVVKGGPPKSPTTKQSKVSEATYNAFSMAKRDYDKDPSNPLALSTYVTQAERLINEFPASDQVKEAMSQAIRNPKTHHLSADQLLQHAEAEDPKDTQDARRLWNTLTSITPIQ